VTGESKISKIYTRFPSWQTITLKRPPFPANPEKRNIRNTFSPKRGSEKERKQFIETEGNAFFVTLQNALKSITEITTV